MPHRKATPNSKEIRRERRSIVQPRDRDNNNYTSRKDSLNYDFLATPLNEKALLQKKRLPLKKLPGIFVATTRFHLLKGEREREIPLVHFSPLGKWIRRSSFTPQFLSLCPVAKSSTPRRSSSLEEGAIDHRFLCGLSHEDSVLFLSIVEMVYLLIMLLLLPMIFFKSTFAKMRLSYCSQVYSYI